MKKLTTDIDKRDNSTNSTATDHNSGSLENDLELSRKIQRAMVPQSLPRIHGIEIDTIFFPCGAIGGDLYDIIQISEDLVAFFVFDVSGHGVSSALISSIAKVLFSNNIHATTSPDNVLKRVNRELKQNIAANFFITAFVAFLDLHSNKLTYCNAGHTYPIVFKKKEKQLIALKTPGLFLGVYNNVNFENREIYLFPEDWFFLFTDGIYSLFNSNEML